MDFTRRSYEKELLDGDDIPFEEIALNMRELETINRWLGGHRLTVRGMRTLARGIRSLHVCEIGCGGGDNLKAVAEWAQREGIDVRLTGIDIKDTCIGFARKRSDLGAPAQWICSDYRHARPEGRPDVVFCSLFCHHFDEPSIVEIMDWMHANSRLGYFINDLQRDRMAYAGIRVLTGLFSRSRLVRHDAPLSVRRGFNRSDLEGLVATASASHPDARFGIRSGWAFRWLVTAEKMGWEHR
jgi:2-polyprenyl-3-methyl-5-hydroxy-6-metoxy-1,4-benzoquinol methylase